MPYKTREQAIAISASLGCPIGAHKTSDGKWIPCRTDEAYRNAKSKTKKRFKPPFNLNKSINDLGYNTFKEGFTIAELSNLEQVVAKREDCSTLLQWINDIFEEFSDMHKNNENENFTIGTEVCKVDESLGLVLGWAIVCKKDGEQYFDLQGDHIPEQSMLEAATDFMLNSRMAKDMHRPDGQLPGSIVFAFPMTSEVAKSFGIETSTTGLMIAMKPDNKEILDKFASGEYTGFSIGGRRIPEFDEEV